MWRKTSVFSKNFFQIFILKHFLRRRVGDSNMGLHYCIGGEPHPAQGARELFLKLNRAGPPKTFLHHFLQRPVSDHQPKMHSGVSASLIHGENFHPQIVPRTNLTEHSVEKKRSLLNELSFQLNLFCRIFSHS